MTQWIFERKRQLETSQHAAPVEQQEQQGEGQQQQQAQEVESMDITPKSVRPDRDNRIFSKAIGSVIGHVNRPERSYQQGLNERSRTRSRSPARRSSRSPPRQSSRYEQDRYSSRHDDRRPTRHEDDRNKSNSIFSRVGHSNTNNAKREGKNHTYSSLKITHNHIL